MGSYEQKIREMQQHLPYLEEKINDIKRETALDNFPDEKREERLRKYQKYHSIINNRTGSSKVSLENLEALDRVIRTWREKDYVHERQAGRDPHEDRQRPGSSCSNTSSCSNQLRQRKLFDDTPASPSPPRSPPAHSSSTSHLHSSGHQPIIIPTERRRESRWSLTPPPPPIISDHLVPITRVNVNDMAPQEWDSDGEDDRPKPRNEIIVADMVTKKFPGTYPEREKAKIEKPAKREFDMPKLPHPSDNIPTVPVNDLDGHRRLKSVLQKHDLVNDFNRLYVLPGRGSPLTTVDGLRSPDADFYMHQSPSQPPFSPNRRDAGLPSKPPTPSLLLNAPPTNSRLPIPIDDVAEYLDDNDRNNLRRQQASTSSRPVSRMPVPSSPNLMSPRSDANTVAPLHSDSRLPGDPRTRPNNDPRTHSVPSTDPRNHGGLPVNDPRSHTAQRYSDGYDRHKRPDAIVPNDYQRHGYAPEPQNMQPSMPMHGMPTSIPDESKKEKASNVSGPGSYNSYGQMAGPHNQMGHNQYDYRQPQQQQQQQQQQQHWGGSSMPPQHMQTSQVPVPPPSYQMNQGSNMPSWQGMQYQQEPIHSTMNGGTPAYSNPMSNNVPRSNPPHVQPMMSNSGYITPQAPKYPSYQDNRQSYNMQQGQKSTNEYQRPRSGWGENSSTSNERYGNRPGAPFRPGGPNSWNKDGPQRPNRDPRMAPERAERDMRVVTDRDPRSTSDSRDPRSRPEQRRPVSPPFPAKDIHKGPLPGKELHPNKFVKPVIAEKEAAAKKRPDIHKPDANKNKERERDSFKDKDKMKDKMKDKDRDKDKSKFKDKTKLKPQRNPGLDITAKYGAIDAKKGAGVLQKFKIPKKRSSIDVQQESTPHTEDWSDEEVPIASTSSRDISKKQSQGSLLKKSSKPSDKNKEKEKNKTTVKHKETKVDSPDKSDRKKPESECKSIDEIDDPMELLKKFGNKDQFSLDEVSSLINKILKKKSEIETDVDNSAKNRDKERSTSPIKKKKKINRNVIESSSDESEPTSADSAKKSKPRKLSVENKTEPCEKKEKDVTKIIEEKQLKVSLKRTVDVKEKDLPDKEPETETATVTETQNAEEETVGTAEEQVADATIETTVKPKPKRRGRFRELDALQEDLKSSWICDGAMKATGSRICNQRNKALEQQQEHVEEEVTAKRTRKPTKKAAPKAKKVVPESTLLASSESEDDDMPLLRRTESLSSVDSKDTSKSKTTPKSSGKKPRIKSIQKVAPPLFDDSSNDSFTLDPSVVEPSTDISLHPEPNDNPGKKKNLKRKKTTTEVGKTAAESSSDESYISNASSSLLLDTREKRDNNAELLDTVMSELANNPQYSVAKKRAAKKKKSNWQMGIVTKKKRKKVPKLDGSLDSLNESNASSHTPSNESIDKPNDDESAIGSNSEDISSRVDPEALIEYTLSSGGEKLQCLLCSSHLKGIVHHYKTSHRGKEVLISRLPVTDANLAVVESLALDPKNNSSSWQNQSIVKYCCRFCSFSTKGENSVAREVFYEHCTTHTGEYRFTCQVCKYEAVAKSSLRAHFYKECKKIAASKNLNEGTTEFPIPDEDRIYGYLCAKCNYVQLRRCNVEKHVKMFHSKNGAEVKIHQIDMSMTVKKEECDEKIKAEDIDSSEVTHKVEPKDEKPAISDVPMVDDEHDIVENNDASEITVLDDEPDLNVTLETIEHKLELKPESSEQKSEKSSNLSAFVCPVELGEKDAEIQNERKKKMQEIAQSIRPRGQKSLSIADKLRDKIETSLPAQEPENIPIENMEVDELNVSTVAPENCTDPLQLPEQPKNEPEEETMPIPQPIPIKEDPDAHEIDEKEKGHSKIKDPLTFVGVSDKHFSNDEGSDGDRLETRAFNTGESDDSTPDQWDQPLPDVGTPVASSLAKGQMTNTILRLRNQLQKTQQTEGAIPDITPPLSPSKIKIEPKNEPVTPPKSDELPKWSDENLPKQDKAHKFIRIRRISGDKLSKGGDQTDGNNEDPDPTMTIAQSMGHLEEDSGFLKIAQVVSLAKNDNDNRIVSDIRKAVEASPQKVRNVSLLKTKPSFILKRVDAPSVMTSSGETLKFIPINSMSSSRATKSENIISIGGQQAVAIKIDSKGMATPMMANTGSTGPTLVSSVNQPFKLVKIASPEGVTNAIKLKSAKVYDRMLQDDKLIHMYKCMGRECYYTTSNEPSFSKHVKIHMSQENPTNRPNDVKKDYFKCAYCYIDCKSCDDLLDHLKKMHIFCRYCCKYCFYRAFAYSYVEIHQKFYHHSKTVHILKVSPEQVQQPPTPKRLDRKQIIKPYVCVHECNKYFFIPEAFILHLSMHHQTLTSFKCHLCSNTAQTTDLLIDHYKTHGYFKYHCVYCTIGAPTVKELHNHLSTAHYNQPPHILERCLPREIEKNVSAIDQLKVRDVDVMYRTRKGVDNDIKIPMPPLIKAPSNTVSLMTADQSIPTAKLIMPKESINSKSFVPLANLDGTVSNIRILESWNFKNSNNPNIINFRPNIKVSMADKSTSKNDQVTFRVLNDDGINTKRLNLFEQKSLLSKQAKNTNVNQGTDSDSDIEIIEEVSNSKSSNRKDLAGKIKEEVTETKVSEPKLEPIEDSPASSRASQSVEEASQSDGNDRFLTLDDVKDTGLTGYELYRCGIENCKFSAENAEDLRAHMLQCSPIDDEFSDSTALYCVHCGPGTKRFSKYSFYIDHIKTHGLKRYKCDLCKAKFSMQSHAQTHLRTKHKYVTSKIVPVDPDNQYPELGLFIVYPMTKKLLKLPDKEVKQTSENEKSSYAPNEIDKLPLQPIYNRALQCAVCSYSNKVRTNLMRHLQAHLEGESVPETGPVNPVPCLEKNEKMFDKMVNLASSSHENGRMGGGGPANYPLKDAAQLEQEDAVPKFVPESKRHVVERHLADKHPEKRQFVKVIRELNSEQAAAAADEKEKEMSAKSDVVPEPEEQEEQPDPDGNNWKCCICDFKCVLKQAMQSHASSVHDEKCQFKCNGCSYKCVSKATFDQHLLTKHMLEPNIEYTTVYRKIKFQTKKTEAVETTTPQAEPFDTTPLWMRNMPRVRHIRGILLEEEEPGKGGKRKSDADGPPKPAKAKPSKTSAQDESRTPEAKKNRNSVDSPSDVKLPDTSITSYGVPIGDFYVCTICTQYKTKYKSDFRDHICRDLKYFKWLCRICDYKSVNRQGLVKHISSRHLGETVDAIQQETNDQIEEWVNLVVKTQSDIMKANKSTDAPDPAPENEEADESEDDDLVIETKEENEENDASEEERDYEVLGSPLSCKHCAKVFAKWRGFKRHVQLKHLQRLGYLCPYCDRSSNSEAIILQHVKSSHQGMTAVAVSNTNLSAPDLTPEFWEREYGLVVPKRAKKRKRREENSDEIRSEFVCDKCDFISHSLAGFKSHLKKHETKIKQKCVYCSFSSFNASEMRQHWEVNHLQHEFRVEEAIVSSAVMEANTRQVKKTKFEDEKKAIVYYCYYCDVRSTALESIRSHWRLVHKDEEKSSIFKYKEHSEPGAKCAYCAEAGSKSTLINHIHEVHGADKPILLVERDEDGWMCRWCLEVFFTTKEEIDQHHKIYHSHLRRDYQLTRRVFNCRRCNKFDTISLETMQKHARTHLNFKCKFCKEVFGAFYLVKAHYKSDHPDKESEHRSINSDEVHQKQVDDIVTESSVFSSVHLTPLPISPAKSPPTSPRLAKKSTTKQILTVVRPYPGKIKAVARKSTNPLPRYPPGIVFDIEERDSPRSYYGRAASPIDLNSLSTTITAGGFKMKANCAKLAELFNINISPTLKIVDFIKERRKKKS